MKNLLFFTLLFSLSIFSQKDRTNLEGKISDNMGVLPNVYILNIATNEATFADDNGIFSLPAKAGDVLQFSFIGYENLTVKVSPENFNTLRKNEFFIRKINYPLDEVKLSRFKLKGELNADINTTPEDKKARALMNTMDFSNVDMRVDFNDDIIDKTVRPPLVDLNPTGSFFTSGTTVSSPFQHSKKLWSLRRDLALREDMPQLLLSEFGENFFFEELKIPTERYYHFLDYCKSKGIETMFKKNQKLKILKMLQAESKQYLQVINESDN